MTRKEAHRLWHKDSWQIAGKIYHKYIDDIYDYFEKELDKVKKEYHIKGSHDCPDAMMNAEKRSKDD